MNKSIARLRIANLLCQISTAWNIDSILDIKTCEPKTDEYSQRRINRIVDPVALGVDDNAVFQYRYDTESSPNEDDVYTTSCMVTTNVDEIHVSLDEENKCVVLSIFTQNTIYILHADIDISGTNVAVIDDIIQKINEELKEKND